MYEIQCACKKSKKNFKFEIGSFFINDCCEKSGYDEFGKTKEDYQKEASQIVEEVLQAPKADVKPIDKIVETTEDLGDEFSDEPAEEELKSSEAAPLKTAEELKDLSIREIQEYLESQNIPFKKGEKNKAKLLALLS